MIVLSLPVAAILRAALRICLGLALGAPLAVPAWAATDGLTALHQFQRNDGAGPNGRLVQGADGRFFGVTYYGGADDLGTVFAVSTDGSFQSLHAFSGADGEGPIAGLIEHGSGTFYGSTPSGHRVVAGTQTRFGGTIFRLTATGGLQTLRTFEPDQPNDGAEPGPLVDGRDGWLYGTTFSGGANGRGTVFKMAPDGTFVTLHHFTAAEGSGPNYLGLTLASDGKFYGALDVGPNDGFHGAVFSVTSSGTVSIVHVFDGNDGSNPLGGLVEATPGTFYGTAFIGGRGGAGTLFRLTANGRFSLLHSFDTPTGGQAFPLALGPDGNFYGVQQFAGDLYYGNIFRLTPSGSFSTLRLLTSSEGAPPNGTPVFGSDGLLYGVNGAQPFGNVFKFDALTQQSSTLSMGLYCWRAYEGLCLRWGYGVSWNSANLDTCQASGAWSGAKPTAGRIEVKPPRRGGTFVYQLNCTGPGGDKSASLTVNVP